MRVIVLGSGVIGTSAAYYLAEAGYQVVVVDRREGRVCFAVPRPLRPDEIVHPYLATTAATPSVSDTARAGDRPSHRYLDRNNNVVATTD